jgi:hypothetical protein
MTSKELSVADSCLCGVERKRFWIWRDDNGVMHASHFAPTNGAVRSVVAATARDALLPLRDGAVPKHMVTDAEDSTISWDGRCASVTSAV